jgi:16S rRNA (guanine966-N2)-methyltransferase
MRVIAGSAKGRRLVAPPGPHTRPTADRVRGAIFNALGSSWALDGCRVLDLFAGSGAMGIEALSRGAEHATFSETDRAARRAIDANLRATGLADRATVVPTDALAVAATPADIAFCDPPYRFDGWAVLLDALAPEFVVIESDREVVLPPSWRLQRVKAYGSTVVTFAAKATEMKER